MRRSWRLAGGLTLGVGVLALAGVGVTRLGAARWRQSVRALTDRLEAARVDEVHRPRVATHHDVRDLDGLPAPVQRFFRSVLTDGQPIVAAVTLALSGRINLSARGERWCEFTSRQRVVTRRPGFVWDARVALCPGLAVHVVDGYVAGEGVLRVALQGLLPLAGAQGGGELARGEWMRYLAEAAWYPTALLPSQGVQWAALDDRSALATVVDGAHTLSMRFVFDAAGLIDSVHAEARGAGVGDKLEMLPWDGRWSAYALRNGMTVPLTGEAAWTRPAGHRPYFVGSVTAIDHEWVA